MTQHRTRGALGRRAALAVAVFVACAAARELSAQPLELLRPGSSGSRLRVSEAEWARELAGALRLFDALSEELATPELFVLLCPERAERATRGGGRRAPARRAFRASLDPQTAGTGASTLRAVASVPVTGIYLLSVEGRGAQRWAVDRRPLGHFDLSALGAALASELLVLERGPHELSATLAGDARVEHAELAAYRPLCIAPAEGWKAERRLTAGALARTLVHALGWEAHLPVDGEPLVVEGEGFATASEGGGRTNGPLLAAASSGAWATADEGPAEFTYRVRLSEPGLFTLRARLRGSEPQIWSIDDRHRIGAVPRAAGGFTWGDLTTLSLASGEHAIRGLVPRGAGIDRLELVRRRSDDANYVALLEAAGLGPRAPGEPVTRAEMRAALSASPLAARAGGFLRRLARGPSDRLFVDEREPGRVVPRFHVALPDDPP